MQMFAATEWRDGMKIVAGGGIWKVYFGPSLWHLGIYFTYQTVWLTAADSLTRGVGNINPSVEKLGTARKTDNSVLGDASLQLNIMMQRTANENAAVLRRIWFGHDFPAGQVLSVRSFLIAATTRYSGFFLLSPVTRFACDISQLAKIWIWVSSEVITICV